MVTGLKWARLKGVSRQKQATVRQVFSVHVLACPVTSHTLCTGAGLPDLRSATCCCCLIIML
jgi:hypothetical protein